DAEPRHGKIVIARLDGTNEATVKKLVIDGPQKFLVPLNPRYPNIPINGNCLIIGVVKGVQYEL
ncbi:LexA family transcriptional regulator, partial [Salmonella enterica]